MKTAVIHGHRTTAAHAFTALTLGALLLLVLPTAARASCGLLDLASIQQTASTTVFAGTVVREDAGHVFVEIDAWFLGDDPVESAEVVGGRDPNLVTSADWTPQPGERYLVVAERATVQGFVTKLCQQRGVDDSVLKDASALFGAPQLPPFASPASSPAPAAPSSNSTNPGDAAGSANGDTGTGTGGAATGWETLALAVALLAIVAVSGALLVLRSRRG